MSISVTPSTSIVAPAEPSVSLTATRLVTVETPASFTAPSSTNVTIENHGQIRSMSFPEGWVMKESPSFEFQSMPTKSWVEVCAQQDERASVCFYYRGAPESTAVGLAFKAILSQPPHSLFPKELKALSTVLRGKDDPAAFSIITARTFDYNEKRVLIIEGRTVKTQEDIYALIVDAEGTGRIIQEIYYQAPKEIYLKYLRDARAALKSIKWKRRMSAGS